MEGNLRYSITVSQFANDVGWSGQRDVGDGFTTILKEAMWQIQKFIVLGGAEMWLEAMAKRHLVTSRRVVGGDKAPQIDRMKPAQMHKT